MLEAYKRRLEQLDSGSSEFYEGEKEIIEEIIKNMEKDVI